MEQLGGVVDEVVAVRLVVVHAFGGYGRGSVIEDPLVVAEVLRGDDALFVNKVLA